MPVFHERTRACAKQTHDAARQPMVNRIEVIEVILSPSHRYMQTIRKAPSYKPVDILGVDSDRCFGGTALFRQSVGSFFTFFASTNNDLTATHFFVLVLYSHSNSPPRRSVFLRMPCRFSSTTDRTCRPTVRSAARTRTTSSCSV